MNDIRNPYKFKGPLDPGEDDLVCIKRGRAVKKIVSGIMKGDYYAVIGPRQIGKTTFLHQVKNEEPYTHFIFIDFESSVVTNENLYQVIIREIQEQGPFENIAKYWDETVGIYGQELAFLNFLEKFQFPSTNKKIIFLFDEIEKIPSINNFLHLWRKIYHERLVKRQLFRYGLVLAGSSSLIALTQGANSPFNIAETYYISDFSNEESLALIDGPLAKMGLQVETEAKDFLLAKVSGHPQLLQHLLYKLVERALEAEKKIKKQFVADTIQELFIESTALETMAQHIKVNNRLEYLLQDILLEGKQKPFYPYKEYAVEGAGAIKNNNSYCVIRNEIYKEFVEGILNENMTITSSPGGKKLLKLQENILEDIPKLKELNEQLLLLSNNLPHGRCLEDLEHFKKSRKQYMKEFKTLTDGQPLDELEELYLKIDESLKKMGTLIEQAEIMLYRKNVLDYYRKDKNESIVQNSLAILNLENLKNIGNIIERLNSNNIADENIHEFLAIFKFLISRVKEGVLNVTHYALLKELENMTEVIKSIQNYRIKFMVYLPLIPLILDNKNSFSQAANPDFDIQAELKELEAKWNNILEKIKK
ncbi:MAG: AAA-like domain-containing protein [Candidatus Aminicenantes bacterium]|nr:AAA-like domain-containing protein [Candidatus Aminicenantes bacterium]